MYYIWILAELFFSRQIKLSDDLKPLGASMKTLVPLIFIFSVFCAQENKAQLRRISKM